jgi:hypothetical protein
MARLTMRKPGTLRDIRHHMRLLTLILCRLGGRAEGFALDRRRPRRNAAARCESTRCGRLGMSGV